MQYAENLVRSAIEPETMVAAVAQNTVCEEIKASEERACRAEHDAEAEDPEDRRAEREVHQVLHNDIAGILCSGEAGLNHCEAGLHKEYQRRRNKRPAYVHRRSKFHDIHFNNPLEIEMACTSPFF